MEDRVMEKNTVNLGVDLWRLCQALWHKLWLMIIVGIIGAMVAGFGTYYFITPQYKSSAMFYVNNSSLSVGDASFDITTGDISASKELVESYLVILKARSTLNEVIDYAELDRSYGELRNMISASSVNGTEIFEVVVTSPNPKEAKIIANAVAKILPKSISKIIDGTSAKVVDYAITASAPSSPNYAKNISFGFVLGMILVAVIVIFWQILDITIRSAEDITQWCKHPILTMVPNMDSKSKRGYYYIEEGQKKKKKRVNRKKKEDAFVGENISFAASESYKLLRTKVQFSFADTSKCHVLGVSSALAGEGKSVSSVNLAYSLAQLEKRVLLIDCDMRRPTIAEKTGVNKTPGLSDYLTAQITLKDVLQVYKKDGISFSVISAGQNPPNPIELLSSERMQKSVKAFCEYYDYVILDLPPVEEVSDAVSVASVIDGILLVVRQDYCNRLALTSTVRQFEFVDARILGIVLNYVAEGKGNYGRKYGYGKYRKYYRKYRRKYAVGNARKEKTEK